MGILLRFSHYSHLESIGNFLFPSKICEERERERERERVFSRGRKWWERDGKFILMKIKSFVVGRERRKCQNIEIGDGCKIYVSPKLH